MYQFNFAVTVYLLAHIFSPGEGLQQFPVGDLRNCPSFAPQDDSSSLYAMDALPGMGFDVLRDIDMGTTTIPCAKSQRMVSTSSPMTSI